MILDPADPTGNLGGKNPEGWRRLAQEAKAWMSYPCFRLWDDSLVSSWCLDETAMWGYRKVINSQGPTADLLGGGRIWLESWDHGLVGSTSVPGLLTFLSVS